MDNNLFTDLGKLAIAGGAGSDVRDDPDFESLQAEIGKMSNPSASGTLDWDKVLTLSTGLLSTKGKDMLVAAYLAGACLQVRGVAGLADGIHVFADMVQTHWDSLFPPVQRLRGRRNALQWLIDRIQASAEAQDWSGLPPQEPEIIERLNADLKAIDAFLREKDEDAPSLRTVTALLANVPVKEIVPEAPPVSEPSEVPASSPVQADRAMPEPVSAPAPAAAQALPPLPSTTLEADGNLGQALEQALEQACTRLGEISSHLLAANLADAKAYRIRRFAAWSGIDALPPVRGDATLIPAPIAQVAGILDKAVASQADENLVRFAEGQLLVYPFWLDLNRLCAQALGRMGDNFAAARQEVMAETARLLARLPGIETLSFAGGKPFADEETRAWGAGLGGSAPGAADGDGADKSEGLTSALAKARVLAAEGNLVEAAATLQRLLSQPISAPQKLLARIRLCELLQTARPHANLEPFAQAIIDQIDHHDLANWDPPLALEGLRAAYSVFAQDNGNRSRSDALLARIATLDAGAAVKLLG